MQLASKMTITRDGNDVVLNACGPGSFHIQTSGHVMNAPNWQDVGPADALRMWVDAA